MSKNTPNDSPGLPPKCAHCGQPAYYRVKVRQVRGSQPATVESSRNLCVTHYERWLQADRERMQDVAERIQRRCL